MSATADISRYRDYFKDLGRGERVEVLAIPSSGQHTIYQRRVSYLEQVQFVMDLTNLMGIILHMIGRQVLRHDVN